jgi:hypothetical protein
MKADKQAKIDRRNEKRGVLKPVHKTYTDIVDEEHKEVPTGDEKKEMKEIVEEYKVEEKKPKRKYSKKVKSS